MPIHKNDLIYISIYDVGCISIWGIDVENLDLRMKLQPVNR